MKFFKYLKLILNVHSVKLCYHILISKDQSTLHTDYILFLSKTLIFTCILMHTSSEFTGGIAIPGACIGIFLGGYLLKRFSLRPKGAIQMVMVFNLIGLSFYGLLFVLGCDNVKMAGTTSPYFNT